LLGEDSGIDTLSEFAVAKNSLRLFGEKICRQYDIKFYWPRIFYVYGPGQRQTSVMPSVIDAFQDGILPSIKNPKNRNDFVYVNDVAKAITGLIETMCDNVIYNIGSGCSVSVEDVMLMISDMVRCKNDNGKAGFARQASGSEDFRADITRIRNDIGWSPEYSLADGIRETVNHYETNIVAMENE
jgi:nucleoside-diphosphate-sugar epimerase